MKNCSPNCFLTFDHQTFHHYNEITKKITPCNHKNLSEDSSFQVFYFDQLHNKVISLTKNELENLLGIYYTSSLIFQRLSLLRNYPFYGYNQSNLYEIPNSYDLNLMHKLDNEKLSSKIYIKRISKSIGLGLFALTDILKGEFIGEYTGILQENIYSTFFDAYGAWYPSMVVFSS